MKFFLKLLLPTLLLASSKLVAQDGTLDSTFGVNGFSTTAITGTAINGYALTQQADGKIIVAGSSKNGSQLNMLIIRYLRNGTIDSTFGLHGIASVDYYGFDDEAMAVHVVDSGKILVAGYAKDVSATYFALTRLRSNGQRDSTFGTNGSVSTGTGDKIIAMAIQSTGKCVVIGTTTMARYTYNGLVDPTFGTGGYVTISSAKDIGLLADDKIIVTGGVGLITKKYSASGIPDATFGNGGGKYENFDSLTCSTYKMRPQNSAQILYIDSNQKVLVASKYMYGCSSTSPEYNKLLKLTTAGVVDTSFKEWKDYYYQTTYPVYKTPVSILKQPNNNYILVTTTENNGSKIGIARILPSGTDDSTFHNTDILKVNYSVFSSVKAILTTDSTVLVLASYTQSTEKGSQSFVRLFSYISSISRNTPQIAFTVNKQVGDTIASIAFTDKTPNALSRTWSFSPNTVIYTSGDAHAVFPSVHFTQPGLYTVKLTCTNQFGTDSLSKRDFIDIGIPPKTFFHTNRTLTDTNSIIQLYDSSMNAATSWDWSITPNTFVFEGGSHAKAANPMVRFKQNGLYSVKLKTSNSYGKDSLTKANLITVSNPFTAIDFQCIPLIGDTSTQFVFFNTSTSTYDLTYNWLFTPNTVQYKNGTTASSKNPVVQFTGAANYSVKLIVSNGSGKDSLLKSNYLTVGLAPKVLFHADSTLVSASGATVQLSDSSLNTPTSWKWTITPATVLFEGGTSATSQHPIVRFQQIGKYTVKLTAANNFGSDSAEYVQYITVGNKPVALFTASQYLGDTSTLFSFTDKSLSAPTSLRWSFYPTTVAYKQGNSTSANIIVRFNDTGTYTVQLRACNDLGCDSLLPSWYIRIGSKPMGSFGINRTTGDTSTVFTLLDSSVNAPSRWKWSFTPSSVSFVSGNDSSQNIQIKCNSMSLYSVRLIVCNPFGCDTVRKDSLINTLLNGMGSLTGKQEAIAVFPNPATEKLSITTTGSNIIGMMIHDLSGRERYAEHNLSAPEHHLSLDAQRLPAGVYFISIITEEGVFNTKILIENH